MKDLMKLAQQTKADLKSIGIQCGTVRNWSVNSRAKARWGLCSCVARGVFDIQIAEALLQDVISDQAVKDTIAHELLHTIPGCLKHTGKWKQLATAVNARLPGYNVKWAESYEDKGLQSPPRENHYRYLIKCNGCGMEVHRQKKSAVVVHPERFRCARCGGTFARVI